MITTTKTENNIFIIHNVIKLKVCNWCGEEFIKKHNRQVYCCDDCSKESGKEKHRERSLKHYHKYKHVMNEERRYGLGSGYLGMHMKTDMNVEYNIIQKEKKRLGLA